MPGARFVAIVTGANSGVGFGICNRLIAQLSRSSPPDSIPTPEVHKYFLSEDEPYVEEPEACDGLTLILACRSMKRAEAARTRLLQAVDAEIVKRKTEGSFDSHAQEFFKNLEVVIHLVDLASVRSVLQFAEEISHHHTYVSHLFLVAGVISWAGIDWLGAVAQFLKDGPIVSTVTPTYKLQTHGELSADGLGWSWQCNVFGHYSLYRQLQGLMEKYHAITSRQARIIWMSSIEAHPSHFRIDDWQLLKCDFPYEASKYEMDLIVGHLEKLQINQMQSSSTEGNDVADERKVRHLLVNPGIVATNIASNAIPWFAVPFMLLSFYFARLLGSQHHTMTPHHSAYSATQVALSPIVLRTPKKRTPPHAPPKYNSQLSLFGREGVSVTDIPEWDSHEQDAAELVNKCEELYQSLLHTEAQEPDITSFKSI